MRRVAGVTLRLTPVDHSQPRERRSFPEWNPEGRPGRGHSHAQHAPKTASKAGRCNSRAAIARRARATWRRRRPEAALLPYIVPRLVGSPTSLATLRYNLLFKWCWRQGSNPRPADYKSAALPTELRQRGAAILHAERQSARAAGRVKKGPGGLCVLPALF